MVFLGSVFSFRFPRGRCWPTIPVSKVSISLSWIAFNAGANFGLYNHFRNVNDPALLLQSYDLKLLMFPFSIFATTVSSLPDNGNDRTVLFYA